MIVIVCVSHKRAWCLYSDAENDHQIEDIGSHFACREGGLWGSECEVRILPVAEIEPVEAASQSEAGN